MKTFILLIFLGLRGLCISQVNSKKIIHSKYLNQDRTVYVNLPENYSLRKDSFSLVFVLDANNKTLFDYAVASKRFLENNSVDLSDFNAPESIIVGIEQEDDRSAEFITNADNFLSYLTKEVLPYLRENYRTQPYSILIGHSLAGRFAISAFLKQPEIFNGIIAASPAFGEKNFDGIAGKFDSLAQYGFTRDRALFISTTYTKNDNTEEQFRSFTEKLKQKFSHQQIPKLRVCFDSSASYGHGKSPFFSIPEGLHFIYDPALWHINYDSTFNTKAGFNLAYLRRYQQGILNLFGVSFSLSRFNSAIIYQLEQENKPAELLQQLLQMVETDPTDLYIYGKLLADLKKTGSNKYHTCLAKFKKTMDYLKVSKEEQAERLEKLERQGN